MGPHTNHDSANGDHLSSEDVPSYQFTALHESSDEEDGEFDAYELLPQYGEDLSDLPEFDSRAERFDAFEENDETADTADDESKAIGVNSSENEENDSKRSDTIQLDEERIEKIKSLMSGFSLPKTSYPQWASFVPEHEWKSFFDAKLVERNASSNA